MGKNFAQQEISDKHMENIVLYSSFTLTVVLQ
jgi:hypothetical protein